MAIDTNNSTLSDGKLSSIYFTETLGGPTFNIDLADPVLKNFKEIRLIKDAAGNIRYGNNVNIGLFYYSNFSKTPHNVGVQILGVMKGTAYETDELGNNIYDLKYRIADLNYSNSFVDVYLNGINLENRGGLITLGYGINTALSLNINKIKEYKNFIEFNSLKLNNELFNINKSFYLNYDDILVNVNNNNKYTSGNDQIRNLMNIVNEDKYFISVNNSWKKTDPIVKDKTFIGYEVRSDYNNSVKLTGTYNFRTYEKYIVPSLANLELNSMCLDKTYSYTSSESFYNNIFLSKSKNPLVDSNENIVLNKIVLPSNSNTPNTNSLDISDFTVNSSVKGSLNLSCSYGLYKLDIQNLGYKSIDDLSKGNIQPNFTFGYDSVINSELPYYIGISLNHSQYGNIFKDLATVVNSTSNDVFYIFNNVLYLKGNVFTGKCLLDLDSNYSTPNSGLVSIPCKIKGVDTTATVYMEFTNMQDYTMRTNIGAHQILTYLKISFFSFYTLEIKYYNNLYYLQLIDNSSKQEFKKITGIKHNLVPFKTVDIITDGVIANLNSKKLFTRDYVLLDSDKVFYLKNYNNNNAFNKITLSMNGTNYNSTTQVIDNLSLKSYVISEEVTFHNVNLGEKLIKTLDKFTLEPYSTSGLTTVVTSKEIINTKYKDIFLKEKISLKNVLTATTSTNTKLYLDDGDVVNINPGYEIYTSAYGHVINLVFSKSLNSVKFTSLFSIDDKTNTVLDLSYFKTDTTNSSYISSPKFCIYYKKNNKYFQLDIKKAYLMNMDTTNMEAYNYIKFICNEDINLDNMEQLFFTYLHSPTLTNDDFDFLNKNNVNAKITLGNIVHYNIPIMKPTHSMQSVIFEGPGVLVPRKSKNPKVVKIMEKTEIVNPNSKSYFGYNNTLANYNDTDFDMFVAKYTFPYPLTADTYSRLGLQQGEDLYFIISFIDEDDINTLTT